MRGHVEAIHITRAAGAPMRPIPSATLRAGVGIMGDRYADGLGHWSDHPAGARDLTLVEGEALDELGFAPGESRRNVTTRGLELDAVLGREFRIGSIRCRADRRCEPCAYLEGIVGRPILRDFVHRAGVRAIILEDGEIAVGDPIELIPSR